MRGSKPLTQSEIDQGIKRTFWTDSVELSIPESLQVVEELVKFLGQKNNQTQQIIRTNKDKENQKIVDQIKQLYARSQPSNESDLLWKVKLAHNVGVIIRGNDAKWLDLDQSKIQFKNGIEIVEDGDAIVFKKGDKTLVRIEE